MVPGAAQDLIQCVAMGTSRHHRYNRGDGPEAIVLPTRSAAQMPDGVPASKEASTEETMKFQRQIADSALQILTRGRNRTASRESSRSGVHCISSNEWPGASDTYARRERHLDAGGRSLLEATNHAQLENHPRHHRMEALME
jgi:hypothetical protein